MSTSYSVVWELISLWLPRRKAIKAEERPSQLWQHSCCGILTDKWWFDEGVKYLQNIRVHWYILRVHNESLGSQIASLSIRFTLSTLYSILHIFSNISSVPRGFEEPKLCKSKEKWKYSLFQLFTVRSRDERQKWLVQRKMQHLKRESRNKLRYIWSERERLDINANYM